MFKILFKGQLEDEFVADKEGAEIMHDWENNLLPDKLKINGSVYDSKSIRAIQNGNSNPDRENVRVQNMVDMAKDNANFEAELQARWAMSPRDKAQSTKIAELMWRANSDLLPTEEDLAAIRLAQEQFFTEYPDYAYANPICYRHLIRGTKTEKTTKNTRNKGLKHIADVLPLGVMRLIEMQIINGIKPA